MSRPPNRRLLFLVACLIGAGLVVGLGYASIPDSNGVIHACYDKAGTLRVIDSPAQSCSAKETPLDWSQTGPQGPPGEPATVKRTRLHYSEIDTFQPTTATAGSYFLLRTVGSFSKDEASTSIKLTWVGHVWQIGEGQCNFQLRIDGANDVGGTGPGVDTTSGGAAVINGESGFSPVGVTTFFEGLSAGTHTVSIWVRTAGVSTPECLSNPGNYGQDVFVEEVN
jgi:hypothetical protein